MKPLLGILIFAAMTSTNYGVMLSGGTKELAVVGNFDPSTESDTNIELGVKAGLFIQDLLEVGGSAGFQDNDTVERWNVGTFAEYNLDLGSDWVPYIGLGLDFAQVDIGTTDENALIFGIEGGVKHFIAPNIAISVALELQAATDDIFPDDGDADSTNFDIDLGMRFFF